MRATVDRFGRVLIAKALRRRLGLEPGDALELAVEGGRLVLTPLRAEPPLVREGRVLVAASAASGGLEEALERLREERLEGLGGPEGRAP